MFLSVLNYIPDFHLSSSFPMKAKLSYVHTILGGHLKGVRTIENSLIGTTKRWLQAHNSGGQYIVVFYLKRGGCLTGA